MDLISLIFIIVLIYVIYTLVLSISSLQREIKEMKFKCIREVYKNDLGALEESTKDPMKTLKDTVIDTFSYLKSAM